jgi:hypothetical protein
VLILLYTAEKRAYLGFIPNDQAAFVDRLRKVIQQQKTTSALTRQAQVIIFTHNRIIYFLSLSWIKNKPGH